MKVTVRRANTNKNNVGMSVHDAFERAREVASSIKNFRVRLIKIGEEGARANWSTIAGDTVADIRPKFDKKQYDLIEVLDDDTRNVIETILVNG